MAVVAILCRFLFEETEIERLRIKGGYVSIVLRCTFTANKLVEQNQISD